MKKIINLTLIGICLMLAGLVMLMAEKIGVNNAKIIVPLLFAISGVLCYLFSSANKSFKIPSQFQLLQGVGLLVFAGVIAFLPDSLKSFLMYTSFFILMFGLLEIMFSFSVLSSKTKVIKSIIAFRLGGGFIVTIGAVALLLTTFSDEFKGVTIAGVLTILIGLSNIIFASKVKNIDVAQ